MEIKTEKMTIYLAGGLFNIGERQRNLELGFELEIQGYNVIYPQKEALKFLKDEKFDLPNLVQNCADLSSKCDVFVGNLDGPDADSGTSVEFGIAFRACQTVGRWAIIGPENKQKPLTILYRTDFRTVREQEVGINGMFNLADKIIYKPAFINTLEEAKQFYRELAMEIDKYIRAI